MKTYTVIKSMAGNVDMLDIEINFDGSFFFHPLRYTDGEIKKIKMPKMDIVSFKEEITRQTVYPYQGIYYRVFQCELENGLMKIDSQDDLLQYYDLVETYGPMEIYLDHFNLDLTHYIQNDNQASTSGAACRLEKGKDKVEFHTDSEYEYSEEDSSESSEAPSLDHLSEGEDELAEVRRNKGKSKEKNLFDLKPCLDEKAELFGVAVEHDAFLDELLKNIHNETVEEAGVEANQEAGELPVFDPETHWRLQKPKVSERYESMLQLKECIRYYALNGGFSIWYEKSTNQQLIARCGQRPPRLQDPDSGKKSKSKRYPAVEKCELKRCPWRCYGRRMKSEASVQVISMIDEHTCARNFRYGALINYKFIAREFALKIRANPSITLREIADMVLKRYKCHVTVSQCARARQYAQTAIEHSLVEHYGMLRAYADEILRSNPGSTVKLEVNVNPDEKVYFDRMYVALQGLKDGWKESCRHVLALDGCFLKTSCQGELLTAVGRDGNNHIYPVAWAVVSVENKNNWTWFLDLLRDDLDLGVCDGLTLISDQHKGLIEAVKDVMPQAEHRQCARHIYENFRKVFSGVQYRSLFWNASKASTPQQFERIMGEIRAANKKAHKYLTEKNPETWSRAFFKLHRGCESVENGFSECFNAILVRARFQPIITMLEAIRVILMERMHDLRSKAEKWVEEICPSIRKKIEYSKDQQRVWRVIPGGGSCFEVRNGFDAFIVDEESRSCACRMWELSGIPCVHAVAVILFVHKEVEDYIPEWFTRTTFLKTYNHFIKPLNGMSLWQTNNLNKPLPPKPRTMPGRPTRKRKRASGEKGGPSSSKSKKDKAGSEMVLRHSKVGVVITCGNCKEPGHNRRKCQKPRVESPAKIAKKMGRPRKSVAPIDDEPVVPQTVVNETQGDDNTGSMDRFILSVEGTLHAESQSSQVMNQFDPIAADPGPVAVVVMHDEIEAHPDIPIQPVPRRRKSSERIANLKLAKKIGGPGGTQESAVSLDD